MKVFDFDKDYPNWQKNPSNGKECLALSQIDRCDKCNRPATVNSVWVISGPDLSILKKGADKLKLIYGELEQLCANEDGDCFCETCYLENEKGEE